MLITFEDHLYEKQGLSDYQNIKNTSAEMEYFHQFSVIHFVELVTYMNQ